MKTHNKDLRTKTRKRRLENEDPKTKTRKRRPKNEDPFVILTQEVPIMLFH